MTEQKASGHSVENESVSSFDLLRIGLVGCARGDTSNPIQHALGDTSNPIQRALGDKEEMVGGVNWGPVVVPVSRVPTALPTLTLSF